jgi:hypothetical protein
VIAAAVALACAAPAQARVVRLRAEPRRATVSLRLPTERSTPFGASLAAAHAAQVAFTLRALGYDRVTLFVNGYSVLPPRAASCHRSRPEPPELEPLDGPRPRRGRRPRKLAALAEASIGVAFHAYAEIPNRPASHGCVRVPYPEASTAYAFATLGTTVIVY